MIVLQAAGKVGCKVLHSVLTLSKPPVKQCPSRDRVHVE